MEARRVRLYHLTRQNLKAPAAGGDYRPLLKNHLGLHSTDYLTPYLSLRARLRDFEPRDLFDDLNRARQAVRLRAFRGTVFVVHRDNVGLILAGSHLFYASTMAQIEKFGRKDGLDFKPAEKKALAMLAGGKRMAAAQINKELRLDKKAAMASFFLRYLEFKGLVVRLGQKHIEDKSIPYGLMEDWLPEAVARKVDPWKALLTLAAAYIRIFGPACLDDLCWWLPIPKTDGKKVIQELKGGLAFFDFNNREYFADRESFRALQGLKLDSAGPVVNFLPYEDHFPKAYLRRDWFLSAEGSGLLMGKGRTELGQLRPSIWLDGEIIGRWEIERPRGRGEPARVVVAGFVGPSPSRRVQSLIDGERRRVEQFLNQKLLPLCGRKEES